MIATAARWKLRFAFQWDDTRTIDCQWLTNTKGACFESCIVGLLFKHIMGPNQIVWNPLKEFMCKNVLQLNFHWVNWPPWELQFSGFLPSAGQTRSYASSKFPVRLAVRLIPVSTSSGIASKVEETDFDLTFSFSSFTLKCSSGIIPAHKVKVQQSCWFWCTGWLKSAAQLA